MMMDIFSCFDPLWFNSIYFTMLFMIAMLTSTYSSYWLNLNKLMTLFFKLLSYVTSQLMGMKSKSVKSASLILSSTFMIILMLNLSGMLPYSFSISSHLIFTLSVSLPLWAMSILSSMNLSLNKTIMHLLPSGAPMWLSPFLVLVESISILVRPLTLSFRLAANMTAGHVILTLLTSFSVTLKMKTFYMIMVMSTSYISFELGICMIQAYIFCLLVSLYMNDHA